MLRVSNIVCVNGNVSIIRGFDNPRVINSLAINPSG